MPKVSVIIPVYNSEKYIKGCLDSVLGQSFKDYEIIVINDGSTDNTLKILKNYSLKHNNFKLLVTENQGVAVARNLGLLEANGEYIKFIDSDDQLYDENSLGKMVNIADCYKLDFVFGTNYTFFKFLGKEIQIGDSFNCSGLTKDGIYITRENKSVPFKEMPNVGNKLFRRSLIGDLTFPAGYKWEDLALIPALIAKTEKFYFINEPVYRYRMRLNNTSVNDALFANDIFQFFDIYQILKQNIGAKTVEYDEELKQLYALHGALKYLMGSLWINMSLKEKRKMFRDYINIMMLEYPNYLNNDFLKEYVQSSPLLKICQFLNKIIIGEFPLEENIDILKKRAKVYSMKLKH